MKIDPTHPSTIPLTKEQIREEISGRVNRISNEFSQGFEFISQFPKSVTFFGSARFTESSEHYIKACSLAGKISKTLGYTILTGGSHGIMEAANRGAFEAGGESVGLNIRLPKEQSGNKYTTASSEFSYFFARKVALSFAAEAYIFFPGGFGTLDEFFEIITLVQTHKIRKVPIFLVGKDYWEPLNKFIKENIFELHKAIGEHDMELYSITDDDEKIISTIRQTPVHDGHIHSKKE
ncbi:MAG: TIGR00730 family Rossman fold protein [Candidatus Taylorbacteria bacterium CG11_big_fil_rev_8_21_14_0_20_46_11]|uniref:Cytokinin riboside 5'-monophosphate phosphoribohydrolase n=1 Tax=Candidatus Taylorbacteria bacterium CG11_big_fil_rev_8_21_14_0_20_46_11 TaxID=1975025 RepID=A0A2H0KBK2_9BACT|nr:MAG: TIGR00730 family Rossman fold protein [Candidatus Taylorbacteria bacterium CG11_big_fil_rev_8_21_14_0_20_46_11]